MSSWIKRLGEISISLSNARIVNRRALWQASETLVTFSLLWKSRWGLVAKIKSKQPKLVRRVLARMPLGYKVKTMTYDHGREFKYHERVGTRLVCKSYFCHPRCPTYEGSVKRWIRNVRKLFPKGTTLDGVSPKIVKKTATEINKMPFTGALHGQRPWDFRMKARQPSPIYEEIYFLLNRGCIRRLHRAAQMSLNHRIR